MAQENWGLTSTGFYCPTFDEILGSKIASAKEYFDDHICTDSNTALGKFLRIESLYDTQLFEELEKLYYSFSVATATGVSLDRAVSFARITRNAAAPAEYDITIYATGSITLKKGTLIKASSGAVFYLTKDCETEKYNSTVKTAESDSESTDDESGEIGALSGTASWSGVGHVCCTEAGSTGNVDDFDELAEPNTAIIGIKLNAQTVVGRDAETDAELAERYATVVNGLGTNTAVSLKAALMKLSCIEDVMIIENNNVSSLDSDGNEQNNIVVSDNLTVPPGSYAIIIYAVESGDDINTEIAETIFAHAPFGVSQAGNLKATTSETVTIEDSSGTFHNVVFTYATENNVSVNVKIKVNSSYASDSIKTAAETSISDYINNLAIGETLIYGRLFEKCYSVAGVKEVTELTINEASQNVTADNDEIIRSGSITVEVG